ncbi:MAG: hypothetical protein AB7N54_11390 [Alphaproteobacteria bacterium]
MSEPDSNPRRTAIRRKNRVTLAVLVGIAVLIYVVFIVRAGGL